MGRDDRPSTTSEDSLQRAVRSMVDGHFDSRHESGAQANAIESIAWSLIGLLAKDEGTVNEAEERISDVLESLGMMRAER